MWSTALDAILTTLRYLAPATLLTLFWGQQSFLFKLLKHIDTAFRAIVFSSEEQKQEVLKWLGEAGLVRVERLETVWRHGWIVCGVLDAALPGACAGHPPTRLSLKHAQAIADHYLGVEPVFSRQELESNDSLSKHQEWKLASYLDRIRQSLAKLTPAVSKPSSQRTSPETTQFTLDYVARGAGLAAAQVNNRATFKIYPTSQQSLDPGEITILIRGPRDTYGMTVIPPILGKAQLIRQKLLGLNSKPNYTENALPITQGATYLRSYGKNNMNKTYHIPKTKYDIEIETETRADHTKVSYIVTLDGKYDISITSKGQGIVGSPFTATASKNIIRTLEKESFCLEDGEEVDILDVKTDRKVVLRIVDFVTEKMLLKENGSLEKITDDEAKVLMTSDKNVSVHNKKDKEDFEKKITEKLSTHQNTSKYKRLKFNKAVNKVMTMNRICKMFNDIGDDKKEDIISNKSCIQQRSQQDIPDIVNSTLIETSMNPFVASDVRSKYIIPENITVSLITEKSYEQEVIPENLSNISLTSKDTSHSDILEVPFPENPLTTYENEEDDIIMVISSSPSNPFLDNTYEENYSREKDYGTYVTSEYETNNSQNEETPESPIKILVEENITETPTHNKNPFIPEVLLIERPKTPVYKIITGDLNNRDDSVYVDPNAGLLSEVMLANEFINPFFMHHHIPHTIKESLPTTDFIIGAPVSLPPIIRASSPIPSMDSLLITTDDIGMSVCAENVDKKHVIQENITCEESKSVFSTPLHTNLASESKFNTNSAFHSIDSNLTEDVEIISVSDNQLEYSETEELQKHGNVTPKKDIWDSAYVSIDDSNSSPDSNNNDNTQLTEPCSKQKFSPSDDHFGLRREDLSNMGPAERELWQTCNELSDVFKISEEQKPSKWDVKRPMFTPIIEESERSISASMKDVSRNETYQSKLGESESVTVAFAELNNLYQDYFPNSETESTTTINEENKLHSLEVDFTLQPNKCVDSASEIQTDVKRQTNELEGKISEVQANVTESDSASQILHGHDNCENTTGESQGDVQFGDNHSNIVLERKKYWDDRIRQIEEKSQESTTLQKKRRISSKYLRQNDSLTKRRGKQIVKNFLSSGDLAQKSPTKTLDRGNVISQKTLLPQYSKERAISDVKLVGEWKRYWDEKLESEKDDAEVSCCNVKLSKSKLPTNDSPKHDVTDIIGEYDDSQNDEETKSVPVKQELPEEVYKAFETSPKRFFGTSRKQILSKIDTFLGKPSTEDNSSTDVTGASHDTGLVSSRISLFHSITNTEESCDQQKSKSIHNNNLRLDSIKDSECLDEILSVEINEKTDESEQAEERKQDIHDSSVIPRQPLEETIREKRSRITCNAFNKSFDESISKENTKGPDKMKNYVRSTIKSFNNADQQVHKYKNTHVLRRKSFSKSEMDIFNKAGNKEFDGDLDKYKSCDELPKVSVKNFITMYETVSKTSVQSKNIGRVRRISSGLQNNNVSSSSVLEAVIKSSANQSPTMRLKEELNEARSEPLSLPSKRNWVNKSFDSISSSGTDIKTNTDPDPDIIQNDDKETTFLSLSDIELEIVEEHSVKSSLESTPERELETVKKDYKSRFKMAKQFFQSLEELREVKKPRKLNECELLLKNKSQDTAESQPSRPPRRVKRNIKSHSLPSSEHAKIWNQLQEKTENEASASKLVKISEKFNVDDLFTDVTEGKLSRQGSLRGIPHKKAVLETFKSMENLSDKKICPYDIVVSQINDFVQENQTKKAQTYLKEYPYLPTTDPSNSQSRVDAKASGLITLKELKDQIPRRNSVPDLRLNPTFTVKL